METSRYKRRSSARLSAANAQSSYSDSLRKATLSRNTITPQTGSSAQVTPSDNSFRLGSGFSSSNNTGNGIAIARAQFLREHQETPRTTMLNLGKLNSNNDGNPHDQITAVNADSHFHTKVSNLAQKQNIKNSSKILRSRIESPNIPNSSADLEESIKIQSLAEETLSLSEKKFQGLKLRRAQGKYKASSYKDYPDSSFSSTEAEKNESTDMDISNIPDIDKENVEHNSVFQKPRAVELKRRSRKTRGQPSIETESYVGNDLRDLKKLTKRLDQFNQSETNNSLQKESPSKTQNSELDMSECSMNADPVAGFPEKYKTLRRTRSSKRHIVEDRKNVESSSNNDMTVTSPKTMTGNPNDESILDTSASLNKTSNNYVLKRLQRYYDIHQKGNKTFQEVLKQQMLDVEISDNSVNVSEINNVADANKQTNTEKSSSGQNQSHKQIETSAIMSNSKHSDPQVVLRSVANAFKRADTNSREKTLFNVPSVQENSSHHTISQNSEVSFSRQEVSNQYKEVIEKTMAEVSDNQSFINQDTSGKSNSNSSKNETLRKHNDEPEIQNAPKDITVVQNVSQDSSVSAVKEKSRRHENEKAYSNSSPMISLKSVGCSKSSTKPLQNTFVVERASQQQGEMAQENSNPIEASPLSVYKTPLSITSLQNSKGKQDYDKKNKRKSVYLVGSQEQENFLFNDEPTAIQSFLPNTESTRIGLNASSEEMSIDIRSTRSSSREKDTNNKPSQLPSKSASSNTNEAPQPPLSSNTLPSTSSHMKDIEQESVSSSISDRNSHELAERLKSIGCWGNRDEVASTLLKRQEQRRIENVATEIKKNRANNSGPKLNVKKTPRKTYNTLLHPREIAYHFERFSGLKLRKGCLPVLVDAFQRFTGLFFKQLRQNKVKHVFSLPDVKVIMQQFGFIPKKDFKNRELYYLLRQILDPEDCRLIIPMSSLNGIAGATTIRKDIWDKRSTPKTKKSKARYR